jgi:hypothetical protein
MMSVVRERPGRGLTTLVPSNWFGGTRYSLSDEAQALFLQMVDAQSTRSERRTSMSRFFRIALALITIAYAGSNMAAYAGSNLAQVAQKKQNGTQAGLLTFGRNTHVGHGLALACDVRSQTPRSHRAGCDEVLYAGGTGSDG